MTKYSLVFFLLVSSTQAISAQEFSLELSLGGAHINGVNNYGDHSRRLNESDSQFSEEASHSQTASISLWYNPSNSPLNLGINYSKVSNIITSWQQEDSCRVPAGSNLACPLVVIANNYQSVDRIDQLSFISAYDFSSSDRLALIAGISIDINRNRTSIFIADASNFSSNQQLNKIGTESDTDVSLGAYLALKRKISEHISLGFNYRHTQPNDFKLHNLNMTVGYDL